MNKLKLYNLNDDFKYLISFFSIIIFSLIICLLLKFSNTYKGYKFFIEFDNAHGIREGTPIRLRGFTVGTIKHLKIQLNSVLTLAEINSSCTHIPKNSIIETNQVGLLSETVVDIIPLKKIIKHPNILKNPFSVLCYSYDIICHSMYFAGDRGLNYDDMIRSTTRISQRFDDPRLFKLLYIFLYNIIELSSKVLILTTDSSDIISLICFYIEKFF